MNPKGSLHDASDGGVSGRSSEPLPFEIVAAPSGPSEFNTVRLRLIPVACWRVDEIRFAFDSSFVTSDIADEFAMLQSLREENKRVDGSGQTLYPPISIFGHADPVGDDDYNKALSGRRATVIYALLIARTEPQKALSLWQRVAREEGWGEDQNALMQASTSLPAGTPQSELLAAYLSRLAPAGLTLGSRDFLAQGADAKGKGDYQGCSEFNPLLVFSARQHAEFASGQQRNDRAAIDARNAANQPNRRVLILLFRPGSQVAPEKWPCPRATEGTTGCRRRFWSDGERRRTLRLPDQERRFDASHDTFACRFYQRITHKSPCEGLFVPIAIRVVDVDYAPLADVPYELTMGALTVTGTTSKEGFIVEKVPPGTTTGSLKCGDCTREIEFAALADSSTVSGAQPRLLNMAAGTVDAQQGVLDEPTQLALKRFQSQHELPTSGQLDEPTAAKLRFRYGA